MTAKQRREAKRTGRIVKHGRTPEAQAAFNKEATFARQERRAGRTVTSKPAVTGTPQDVKRGTLKPGTLTPTRDEKRVETGTTIVPEQTQPEATPELAEGTQEGFQLEQPVLDEQGRPILKSMEEQEMIDNLKLNMDPAFASERAGAEPMATPAEVATVLVATGVVVAVAVLAAEALIAAAGLGLAPVVARTTMGLAPKNIWTVSPGGVVRISTVGKELVVRQASTVGGKVPGGTRIFPTGEPAWAVGRRGVEYAKGKVSRVATNPVTAERTRIFIGKLFPKGFKQRLYANIVLTTLSTWIPAVGIGFWGKNEGLDGLTHARDKALDEGNQSLADEIKKDIDIVSNESVWRQVGAVLPATSIPISILRINEKMKGNKKWNQLLDEKTLRLSEGGLTPEEAKFEKIRTEKTAEQEKLTEDIAARDVVQADIREETAESISESQKFQRERDKLFAELRGEELPQTPEETAALHEELFTRKKK